MSIADEITRIKNAKTNLATSIANKGVTVPEETKIDGYSALVDKIIDSATIVIEATTIANNQYANGVGLEGKKTIVLPNVETIEQRAFFNAKEVETIDIGEKVNYTNGVSFDGCKKLSTLILRGLSTYTASTLQLTDTPIAAGDGYIYVPDNLLEQYKSALQWIRFKKQIKPLSILGTITLQPKTVTPTINEQIVTPDDEYHGLSKVTVNPIPDKYQDVTEVTATVDDVLKGTKIVTKEGELVEGAIETVKLIKKTLTIEQPTVSIPQGYHKEKGTVSIVTETKTETPNKITQTIEPTSGKVLSKVIINPIPDKYQDVSGVTATAEYVHPDKKFVTANGELVSGKMINNGDVSGTIDGVNNTLVKIPAGYTTGGTVTYIGSGGGGGVDVSGVTATADDVLKGKQIVTKDGKLVEGAIDTVEPIDKTLTVGETCIIPVGYYNVEGKVKSVAAVDPTILTLDTTTIADKQFENGAGLEGIKTIVLPNVETIGSAAFACNNEFVELSEIETIDIGEKVTSINATSFNGCSKLRTLIIRKFYNTTTPQLARTSLKYGGGYIYVPDEYVGDYKSAKQWAQFKSQIKPLSKLGTIALQTKTVTSTINEQIVTPDDDYYGLSKVTVEALSLQSKTVPPTKEQQTVTPDNEYVGLSDVTVEAIPNNYIDSADMTEEVTLNITTVSDKQFQGTKCIKELNLPYVEYIDGGAFSDSDIETLDIGSNIQDISTTGLNNMTKLSTLIIRGKPTHITKLSLTFSLIWKGEGYIYVPDDYVEHFKTSVFTGTSPDPYNVALKDRVKPLSELQIGDGVDVSGVTATAADVLKGKKIVTKDGNLVEGAIDTVEPINKTLTIEQPTVSILKGYHKEKGTVSIVTETKTETPNKITQTIKPTSGKVLSEVIINPIPDEYHNITTFEETITLNVKDVKAGAFANTTGIKKVCLPNVETIGTTILQGSDVEILDIGANIKTIATGAFAGSAEKPSKLKALIFRGYWNETRLNLGWTPIKDGQGYVYVPKEYVEEFKSVAMSNYPNQVKPLTEYVDDSSLQSKTVTPSETQKKVTPDEGYYGLSDVTVEPIPDKYQDISDIVLSPEFVLDGVRYVDSSGTHIGKMPKYPNNEIWNISLSYNSSTYRIPEGYHDGQETVSVHAVDNYTLFPSKTAQTISAASFNGAFLESVTVNPIPNKYQDITSFTSATLNITSVEDNQFFGSLLRELILPNVTSLGNYCFYNSAIETLDLGEGLTRLPIEAFSGMEQLTKLILRSYCDMHESGVHMTFANTPIYEGNGYIYVPDNLLEQYKTNLYWKDIASQIKSISDIEPSVLYMTDVGDRQFNGLQVDTLSLPNVVSIGGLAFENSAIKTLIIGENLQTVYQDAYNNMLNLTKVIFKGWCPPLYTSLPFMGSPIANGDGYIYVPDELYQDYLNDSYWVSYSNMIKKISEL